MGARDLLVRSSGPSVLGSPEIRVRFSKLERRPNWSPDKRGGLPPHASLFLGPARRVVGLVVLHGRSERGLAPADRAASSGGAADRASTAARRDHLAGLHIDRLRRARSARGRRVAFRDQSFGAVLAGLSASARSPGLAPAGSPCSAARWPQARAVRAFRRRGGPRPAPTLRRPRRRPAGEALRQSPRARSRGDPVRRPCGRP